LTRAASTRADPADETRLAGLPVPRRLLLIGGPTMFWKISQTEVFRTLSTMIGEAKDKGGSVLVSTSPRTPAKLSDAVATLLGRSDVPSLLTSPGEPPRYRAMLAAADSIRVTADSVAMVSDAIWTGKPIALVPIAETMIGRPILAVVDRLRPGRSLYPRDLRRFWTALAAIGVTEKLTTPRSSAAEQLRKVLARVRPILKSLNQ
jgi:hypothetical protein